jgi:lipopolysaccharide/colanic/teichoic acid biosynthesis glycosyltransferase
MTRRSSRHDRRQRVVDVVVGAFLLVVSAPVQVAALAVSAVVFRASPVFVQARVGRDGRRFRMMKIRSLPVHTPTDADKYAISSAPNHRWGEWIRSRHLDELPQLWSVVTGSMSLVGPRPEMERLAAEFDPAFADERSSVRPGCTGLWQVSAASVGLIREHPEYDLHYVRHRTLRLDVWILYATVRVAVSHRSIGGLGEIPGWTGAAVAAGPDRRVAAHG